jgi:hypothetical protein
MKPVFAHKIGELAVTIRIYADMEKSLWPIVAVLIVPLLAIGAEAVPRPAPPESLEEVEVTGHANKLIVIRDRIHLLEDKFNDGYNKANTDHQYDVSCVSEVPLGTHIPTRFCQPVFAARAKEDEAKDWLQGHSGPPASLVILMKAKDYQKNMIAVVQKHPELLELLKERKALIARLEEVRNEKFKGKTIVWD